MAHPPALLPLGKPFIELQSVDSTNNYARSLLEKEKDAHGTAVFAHAQWKGKGQRGKQWNSEEGANLLLSLIIDPKIVEITEPFWLSATIALSGHSLVSGYVGDVVTIKWPNDLYWKDQKLGGILIENIFGANSHGWKWAIVGIGINVNQVRFPADLPNPVSIKQIMNKDFNPVILAKELCEQVNVYVGLLHRHGFAWILNKYNDHLYKKEQVVKLKKENRLFEARLKKISEDGKLVVTNSIEEEFSYEEVEWVR